MNDAETNNECRTGLSKKFYLQFAVAIAVYSMVLVGSIYWLKLGHPASPWKWLIAVMPVFPAILIPAAVVRFFRDLDEFQQKVQLEGLAFGFTGAAVLTLAFGFLENAGMPRLSWVWVWPVMSVCWVAGILFAIARYK
jgi:ABC-type cobalamin transport system permease subunit